MCDIVSLLSSSPGRALHSGMSPVKHEARQGYQSIKYDTLTLWDVLNSTKCDSCNNLDRVALY